MEVETPPTVESLNERLMRMELLLEQSNSKHDKELDEAREENKKLRKHLNAVASNHDSRLRDKEDK